MVPTSCEIAHATSRTARPQGAKQCLRWVAFVELQLPGKRVHERAMHFSRRAWVGPRPRNLRRAMSPHRQVPHRARAPRPVIGYLFHSSTRIRVARAALSSRTRAIGQGQYGRPAASGAAWRISTILGAFGELRQSASAAYGETLYYRTQLVVPPSYETYDVLRRLSDDRALAVTRLPAHCYSSPDKHGAPLLFEYLGDDSTHRWGTRFDLVSGALVPPVILVPFGAPAYYWFSFDSGWGASVGGATIEAVLKSEPSTFTTLFTDGSTVDTTRAHGDLRRLD